MEIIINANGTVDDWKVEAGDIVTEKTTYNGKEYYYIIVEQDCNEFMVTNLTDTAFKKFETTSTVYKDAHDIKEEYSLVKKHNEIKVDFSW